MMKIFTVRITRISNFRTCESLSKYSNRIQLLDIESCGDIDDNGLQKLALVSLTFYLAASLNVSLDMIFS